MNRLFFLIPFVIAGIRVSGQDSESPINVEALYVAEGVSNFSGGIKTGQTYLGLIDFGLGFNTSDLGLWKNGEFFVLMENTHGGRPSAEYIGDLQVASNIENGDFTYLYEFWYKHQIGKLGLKIGVLDLNADCHVSELGGLFQNSSFGIMPSASLNMPVPIFPLPAAGIFLNYDISERFALLAGIWDGDPGDFENNRYNVEWTLNNREGFLYMLEGHLNYGATKNKPGELKIGGLYHSGSFENLTDSTMSNRGNLELHLIAEHTLISKDEGEKGNLGAFLQIGYLPDDKISSVPFYIGAGACYKGLFFNSANDVLGLGFAYAGISNKLVNMPVEPGMPTIESYELAIELSYELPVLSNLTIYPDFQYIINPGAQSNLENAFVGFLRIIITH